MANSAPHRRPRWQATALPTSQGNEATPMIWIILTFLGVPLWLCALALLLLLRGRSRVKNIPGGFPCKARLLSGSLAGLKQEFPRNASVGHWIHEVLVLHGGSPFLNRMTLCGIAATAGGPAGIDHAAAKRFTDPVAAQFRLDGGQSIEVVCARRDLAALRYPAAPRAGEPPR